jgi:hypothetical protein
METLTKRQKLMVYLANAADDTVEALFTLLIKNTEEEDKDDDEMHDITDEQFLQLENERESYINNRDKKNS